MPGPAGNSLFIPTGAAPSFEDWLKTDPFYQQNLIDIDTGATEALSDLDRQETQYGQNWQNDWNAANASYDPNYDYGLGNAQAQTALQLQKAAHDNAMRAEYLNEWLTSRGIKDSGQTALEQGEREFQYGAGVEGINLGLAGQTQEATRAKTQAQNALAARIAELTTNKGQFLENLQDTREDVLPGAARAKGQAAMDAWQRATDSGALMQPGVNAIWDDASQLYVTSDGKYYRIENGVPVLTTWNAPPPPNNYDSTAAPGTTGGYTGAPPPATGPEISPWVAELAQVPAGPITQYPVSRPEENVIPGAGWGYA